MGQGCGTRWYPVSETHVPVFLPLPLCGSLSSVGQEGQVDSCHLTVTLGFLGPL